MHHGVAVVQAGISEGQDEWRRYSTVARFRTLIADSFARKTAALYYRHTIRDGPPVGGEWPVARGRDHMRSIAADKAREYLLVLLSPIAAVGCLIAYVMIAAMSRIRRTDSTPD